ncbi:MAG: Crp/Fnr family transcriptional regulator [Pseudobdellovibrionaceae bacterium]
MEQEATILFSSPWQKIPFLSGLDPFLIQRLLIGSELVSTKARQVVFSQNTSADAFGFVIEGLFRLQRMNEKNQRIIMDFAAPGSMVGSLLMCHPQIQYPISLESIGKGQFLKIPKQTYLQSWIQDPEVIRRTQMANQERMMAIQFVREWQKYPLEEKVASLLLHLSPMTDNWVRLSRTDISDVVGASVESVIRVFSQWEKLGLIQKIEKRKEIFNRERLQTEVLNGRTTIHGVS